MKKLLLSISLFLVLALPSFAVFNEKDLAMTLQVLRYELAQAYYEMEHNELHFESQDESQHEELVHLIQNCNELSLMLYSQKQNFTFDLTYALHQVTKQYYEFNERRLPYDNIISYFDVEIERYTRLVSTLEMLPPSLVEIPDSLDPMMLDSLTATLQTRTLPNESYSDQHADDPDHEGHHHEHDADSVSTFLLSEQSQEDRDSCLAYSRKLLKMFTDLRDHTKEDSEYYEKTSNMLKDSYEYAQERYKLVQKRIFVEGQDNYWKVLTNFPSYVRMAVKDSRDKYGKNNYTSIKSEWRGPMVVGFSFMVLIYLIIATVLSNVIVRLLQKKVEYFKKPEFQKTRIAWLLLGAAVLFVIVILIVRLSSPNAHFFKMASGLLVDFALMLIAVLVSMLIRNEGSQTNKGIRLYAPIMVLGLLVITFRIIFIPNSLITLLFPPLLLLFGIWQYIEVKKVGNDVQKTDRNFAIGTLVVIGITLVMSVIGYVLMAVQVYIWWIFQFTVLQMIIAASVLLKRYRSVSIDKKVRAYRIKNPNMVSKDKGSYVAVTWLYDMFDMAVIPVLMVLSFPLCIYLASKVFDLTEICMQLLSYPFLNYDYIHLSVTKILVAVGLFYIFNYLSYVIKGFYRILKLQRVMSRAGTKFIHENEVNLTLANNVIGILVWGTYVVTTIILLKIPTKSLSVITAGLAAGLGFAMKDILNNFFYGVQLMSGRLRVGDYIECDGIRGKVDSINYQMTQIAAEDGSVIAFANSTLFGKNFKNLTRNHSYEYLPLKIGIAYGSDVEQARRVILRALAPLRRSDKYGRAVVEPKYGIKVMLTGFGDSSVDLTVKQYVLVTERYNYIDKANDAIYRALNENGIEIPFPQTDVHVKDVPQKPEEEPSDEEKTDKD
jgi:potassium efflux system protein